MPVGDENGQQAEARSDSNMADGIGRSPNLDAGRADRRSTLCRAKIRESCE
jgi:hypothetical protein